MNKEQAEQFLKVLEETTDLDELRFLATVLAAKEEAVQYAIKQTFVKAAKEAKTPEEMLWVENLYNTVRSNTNSAIQDVQMEILMGALKKMGGGDFPGFSGA